MRRPLVAFTAMALLLALTALGGAATADDTTSDVTVVHGIPGVTVDVYVNDDLTLEDFEPGDIAGPLALPAGDYDIAIRPAGAPDDSDPVLAGTASVPGGANISLVAHRAADDSLALTPFVNDLGAVRAGEGRLVVRHTAGAPGVDVRAGGQVVFSNLTNPNEASADLPAGTVSADVVLTGTSTVVIGPADVPVVAGQSTIVYAVGSAADGDLGVVVQTISDLPVRTAGRLSGPGRIETAVAISQRAFPDGSAAVYLARADIFPDALAAGSLTDGPILLVNTCDPVPAVVKAEIARLNPAEVIALGGTAAICEATLQDALSS
jgi:hypothetical protein